ncbi:BCD family MFS transporter [Methylocella silvestris]|uniref:MFS transporter n=1 Tax=Methylocella silvestris TaxID=199596 RepID=A0A2J7TDF7_METSI|nr:BCD family MFS transporter [Methylocella silvestris]PNG24779.1 MFS transporter [Methylocella silvestris]
MTKLNEKLARNWMRLSPSLLPFADAATVELPLGKLLRLSLFQVSVGVSIVLLVGTLNRVMIVELGVPAWLVALMVSLPLVFAPFRAVVGFRSDAHRSALGWRRVPYLWLGSLVQFGGLAIMPFALIILSGDSNGPIWAGHVAAALAFLLVGAGLHTTQTVGLALATDLAPAHARPRVVALLCMMLLVGMLASALAFGALLANFSELRLIQVIQGAAVLTMGLNMIALWKQEPRRALQPLIAPRPSFAASWSAYLRQSERARRRLLVIALGTAAFSMEDILLEPYGGQVLRLPVGATTALTAMLAIGSICGLWLAARLLGRAADPYRVSAYGLLAGLAAFSAVIFAAPLDSAQLFGVGTVLIGFGAGLFAHGTLTATMNQARRDAAGMALGAWGAAQASAAGLAIALGGAIADGVSTLAAQGAFGPAVAAPATGYIAVYMIELMLMFVTLVAIGPLVRHDAREGGAAGAFELGKSAG